MFVDELADCLFVYASSCLCDCDLRSGRGRRAQRLSESAAQPSPPLSGGSSLAEGKLPSALSSAGREARLTDTSRRGLGPAGAGGQAQTQYAEEHVLVYKQTQTTLSINTQ